jgi:hypothetical protein
MKSNESLLIDCSTLSLLTEAAIEVKDNCQTLLDQGHLDLVDEAELKQLEAAVERSQALLKTFKGKQ